MILKLEHLFVFLIAISLSSCVISSKDHMNLGTKTGWYEDPAWSLNGEKIIVQFAPDGGTDYQLIQLKASGDEWFDLTTTPFDLSPNSHPLWVDENTIVFIRSHTNLDTLVSSSAIVFYDTTQKTEDEHPLYSYFSDMSIDPINHQLALVSDYQIKLYDIERNALSVLIKRQAGRFEYIAFDPTGKKIAYSLTKQVQNTNYYSLIIFDISTEEQQVLIDQITTSIADITWSPDSQWIALRQVDKDYQSKILLIKSDGSEQKNVNIDFAQPADISWSPKGNMLAMTAIGRPGQNSLYVIDLTPWLENSTNAP